MILDTAPGRRWKRFRPEVTARFETLREGDPLAIALLHLANERGPLRQAALDFTAEQLAQAVASRALLALGGDYVIHADSWARIVDRVGRTLAQFHSAEPLRLGLPREALRNQLRLSPEAFEAILTALADHGHVRLVGNGAISAPEHEVQYTAAQRTALDRLRRDFERAPHTPPTAGQIREAVGDDVLISLIEHGELVRISDDVLLTPDVLREWIAFARATLDAGQPLTVAVLRDHFQTTRRYALDFLERLDALRITRRTGDERVLGSGDWLRLLPDADQE